MSQSQPAPAVAPTCFRPALGYTVDKAHSVSCPVRAEFRVSVHYAFAHYVFRVLGFFGPNATSPKETWSTGFRLANPSSDVLTAVSYTAFLESVQGAIATYHGGSGPMAGTKTFLSELTIARVGTDGKYNPDTMQTWRRPYTTPVAGTSVPLGPWSQSMVLSLRTAFARGIASNGRTYWPAVGMPLQESTGRIYSGDVDRFLTNSKTLVQAINSAAQAELGSNVKVSVVGADGKTGAARTAHVTSLRADDRCDAIERRENDQQSAYTTITI